VLIDKTGTLTKNQMELKLLSIGNQAYGLKATLSENFLSMNIKQSVIYENNDSGVCYTFND
jgi:magnesium-transporting ATPase (P-type)